ncbi:MAG TPA: hypothetical protein ENK85_04405 [Saprospiraceae bacterium]|nr:hypothetical protein [Saprospiraceae bacterium]
MNEVAKVGVFLVFGAQQAAFGLWCAPCGRFWSLGRSKLLLVLGRSKLLFCAASCYFAHQAAILRSKLLRGCV